MRLTNLHWRGLGAALCAMGLALSLTPALAAEIYPCEVREYMVGDSPRVVRVYQLSLSDNPSIIPTGDFERDSYLYHLLDVTQAHDVGVDTRTHTEMITVDSDTGKMADILQRLEGQMTITTEDGYTGSLTLDHTSVKVQAKGYKTSTKNLSATRTYPNLSDTDLSLVPKTVQEDGQTLTLANVQWSENGGYFTAVATYSGTATSRYATGYVVTANYSGQVAKPNCEVVTYTAIFTGKKIEPEPEETPVPSDTPAPSETPVPSETPEPSPPPVEQESANGPTWPDVVGCIGGVAGIAAMLIWVIHYARRRSGL